MMNVLRLAAFVMTLMVTVSSLQGEEPATLLRSKHVILVTVDGLAAYLLNDPNACLPNIQRLAKRGTFAEGMTVSNPSVTWPNHTTLITGVTPARHGVLFNGVLTRPALGVPPVVDGRKDGRELVAATTLFHLAHAKGMGTAGIDWPCTRNDDSVDDNMPDTPDMLKYSTPRLLKELEDQHILTAAQAGKVGSLSPALRDRIWTETAIHILKTRRPAFMTLHLLNLDGSQHKYGPQTLGGYSAVAYADTCVGELVRAIEENGLQNDTTLIVTADHGFASIPRTLLPNVTLRDAGFLKLDGSKIESARAFAIPEGGTAMIYLTVPDRKAEDLAAIRKLFEGHAGIETVLGPGDFAKLGLPSPEDSSQMADLVLVGKKGYGFANTATGSVDEIESTATLGTHGLLSTNDLMQATFVMAGANVRKGGQLPTIRNVDVAPTIAALLGLTLPETSGQILNDALEPASIAW